MNLAEFYRLLLQQEIAEAKFKFERKLQHYHKPIQPLIVSEVEGSLVTRSPEAAPEFQSFNVARIQDTSPSGIKELIRIFAGSEHSLLTAPLGLMEDSYMELQAQGYAMFHQRSVLSLRVDSSLSHAETADVHIESLESDFSSAHTVLNSFHPTSQANFDQSYTYWLRQNKNARLYIAKLGSEPVAMGILSWAGSTGILSSGVVSASARGKGIQKILIRHRIQEARRLGLNALFAPGVPPFCASEASLRKCGFNLICTRSFWKKA